MKIHFFNIDPSKSTLDYPKAFKLVQSKLKELPYGTMKKFCEDNELPYFTISKVKNNKITFVAPLLITKSLIAFGYKNVEHQSHEYFTFDK